MMLLILIVGIILIVCGFTVYKKYEDSEVASWLILIGFVVAFIAVVGACMLGDPLVNARDVDERISMYEEQNAEIESQVETAVKLYMSHEDEIFESASPEDYVMLVSLYPDLKSDTLMQKQIELYIDNNKKICELKEEKITAQRSKFWLYFGR